MLGTHIFAVKSNFPKLAKARPVPRGRGGGCGGGARGGGGEYRHGNYLYAFMNQIKLQDGNRIAPV